MKRTVTLIFSLTLILFSFQSFGQAVITAVFDGPLTGGTPKGVEIFIIQDIADQTMLGISSANNGTGATGSPEYVFPEGSLTAGSYIYVTNSSSMFNAFFGMDADFEDDVVLINGDDAIELFFDGNVIDVFGDVNVDGTGTTWEYLDGWAARNMGTGPDGSTFVESNWTFSGIDALDGETTNALAANPVPLQSYGGVQPDLTIAASGLSFTPSVVVIDINTTIRWENISGSHNVNGSVLTNPNNPEGFLSGVPAPAPWTYDYTFTVPGVYHYQCDLHVGAGMTGIVVVREPADHYIDVENNFFAPADITITQQESVSWINISGNHNVNGSQATYPGNPESFLSGDADENWIFTHTFETPGVYDYQCDPHVDQDMVGTITVMDKYVNHTIPELRENNAQGEAVRAGDFVRVEGIVYAPNFRPEGLTFVIQNESGVGINIFSDLSDLGYTVTDGDQIRVEGQMNQFFGLSQVTADKIDVLSSGNTILEPRVVTSLGEDTESSLVTLEGLSFVDIQTWPGAGVDGNVLATLGVDTFVIRVDKDVNLSTPGQGVFNITGIGGQFDGSSPLDQGYQLLPRTDADIQMANSVSDIAFDFGARIYPIPASTNLTISSDYDFDRIVVRNQLGQVVHQIETPERKIDIDVAQWTAGSYLLELRLDRQVQYIKWIKK